MRIYSGATQLQLRLYSLSFVAARRLDFTAFAAFFWELREHNADAAEALNYEVATDEHVFNALEDARAK